MWIAQATPVLAIAEGRRRCTWSNILTVTGLTLSMTMNALVTGLIVFRIFRVYREVKDCNGDDRILGGTGGSTLLRRIIFILIESGMALFSIQLARLLVSIVILFTDPNVPHPAFLLIIGIHEMLNVIIRSVIAVLFY